METGKFKALGTLVEIRIVCKNKARTKKARADVRKAKEIFLSKQKIFSRFDSKSELSKLNRRPGIWQKTSPDIAYLAGRALFYNRESGGLYDPRIIDVLENIGYKSENTAHRALNMAGMTKNLSVDLRIKENKVFFGRRMDFSGIAKGYIIDQAAQFLKKRGWKNFFINAGGDAYAAGLDTDGKKWKLPIEGARDKGAAIRISNRGAATSGVMKKCWKYRGKNVHHLVNPKNPEKFSFDIKTVLVIHKKTEWADGRAKVLVLAGKKEGLARAKQMKLKAIFVDKFGNLIYENIRESHPPRGKKRGCENFRGRV
jgi:thiamine biosynthesis lipoprotein